MLFHVSFDIVNQTFTLLCDTIIQNDPFVRFKFTRSFPLFLIFSVGTCRHSRRSLSLDLLTWLDTIVINVDSKVLALTISVDH